MSRTCHLRSANDPKRTSRLPVFRPSFTIKGIELFIRQLDIGGGDILFQMRDLGRARNGQHDGTALEHPCERDLARGSLCVPKADTLQYAACATLSAPSRPGDDLPYVFSGSLVVRGTGDRDRRIE